MSSWGQLLYSAAHRGTTVPCREWLFDRRSLILDQPHTEAQRHRVKLGRAWVDTAYPFVLWYFSVSPCPRESLAVNAHPSSGEDSNPRTYSRIASAQGAFGGERVRDRVTKTASAGAGTAYEKHWIRWRSRVTLRLK